MTNDQLIADYIARGGAVRVIPENTSGRNGGVIKTRRPSNEYLGRTRAEQFFININKR